MAAAAMRPPSTPTGIMVAKGPALGVEVEAVFCAFAAEPVVDAVCEAAVVAAAVPEAVVEVSDAVVLQTTESGKSVTPEPLQRRLA